MRNKVNKTNNNPMLLIEKTFDKFIKKTNDLNYQLIIIATIVFFGFAFSTLSLLRFNHFMMGSYDLSIFDQAIWHYGRFEAPISTVREMNILGDHFSPLLILFSPFRLLWPNAQILLVLQAFIASSSLYFIFLVLDKKLNNHSAAYLLSLTTYFFLGFQYSLDYDFHLISLATLPISILLYGLFNNKIRAYWFGALLMMLLKEDMAVIIFFVGIYQMVINKKVKLGAITSIIAALFFYLESSYLMKLFQDDPSVVKNYVDFYTLGNTKQEIILTSLTKPWIVFQTMTNSPEKINTFIQTHLPFGFLPLLSPFYLISALPIWLERFLSFTQTRWLFDQYYGIPLTPFLVIGTGNTIHLLSRKIKLKIFKIPSVLWLTLIIFIISSATMILQHAPLTRLIHKEYYQLSEAEQSMHQAVKMIPKTASVSAQQPFVSHLSGRSEIYWFPKNTDIAEYIIVINSRPATPLNNEERDQYLSGLLSDSNKKLIYEENGVYLFEN